MIKKTVLLIITLDTKGKEASYIKQVIEKKGLDLLVMDVGVFPSPVMEGDIKREEVIAAGGEKDLQALLTSKDKGRAIQAVIKGSTALTNSLYEAGKIHGVVSLGGAQGTIIGTTAMKTLPIGFPKLMVSTVASGKRTFDLYVGTSDITLMHSVVDFFGPNAILHQILRNAAGAIAGMVTTEEILPTPKKSGDHHLWNDNTCRHGHRFSITERML